MIEIGSKNWVQQLKEATAPIGRDFWSGFTRATEDELARLESVIGRKLPAEFLEFYRSIGYGQFSLGGGFDSPDDILMDLGAPIYFLLGSLSPSEEWATQEQHKQLWLSRGEANPDPERFSDSALLIEGVYLYDLLQFGSNGCCCYHQIYVGPEPAPLRYCLLTDGQTMEDKAAGLSEALGTIIASYLDED